MTNVPRNRRSSASLVLAVVLGGERYGIPVEYVDEVLPALPVESLPECPAYVRGVVILHDQLIPVIDGAQRWLLNGHQPPLEPHIVCLRIDGRLVGLQVDEALELVEVASVPLSLAEMGTSGAFCASIGNLDDEVIRILDPAQLRSDLQSSSGKDVANSRRGGTQAEHAP